MFTKTFRNHDRVAKTDFVIAGTQKGGTSVLDSYLRDHPQICMARRKEVHFFDNEEFFKNNNPDYSVYDSFFKCDVGDRKRGESTPIYMYWYDAPRRMWDYNPLLRIIVLLRNPIERAYSHWNMERDRSIENLDFLDAIQREVERCREALPLQHRVYSYADRGFYTEQLRRVWHFFGKEQTLVLRNEDLRSDPEATLSKVCSFLEVDSFGVVEPRQVHAIPYTRKMTADERDYLKALYSLEIRELEQLLGWDCSGWLD
jgi:hypothetical protein